MTAKKTKWGDIEITIPHIIDSDLLPDLLISLPLKSLIRFRLVCKRWESLIVSNPMILRRLLTFNQNTTPAGLLILLGTRQHMKLDYVPFCTAATTTANPTFTNLGFGIDLYASLQSCNGLLLCSDYSAGSRRYYICNPTTKKFLRVPEPDGKGSLWTSIMGMCLAFDPADSPHYKIVVVVKTFTWDFACQIYNYSSHTGLWRVSGRPLEGWLSGVQGVYWNGAIHWISACRLDSAYFNVEKQLLLRMPNVPMKPAMVKDGTNGYFCGESRGHLYFADSGFKELDIYEMKIDYSEWFLKHTVNLLETEMGKYNYRIVVILSVVCGEDDNVSFLVLRVLGKVIRYNVVSKTCEKLCDIEDNNCQII